MLISNGIIEKGSHGLVYKKTIYGIQWYDAYNQCVYQQNIIFQGPILHFSKAFDKVRYTCLLNNKTLKIALTKINSIFMFFIGRWLLVGNSLRCIDPSTYLK